MNWDAIGAIAEMLGAIAVFATLAYLAVQVRQSNIVTREQAQYHMLQNQIRYFDSLAENADFARTVYGVESTEQEIQFRQHEAHVASLLFRWNWEYLRVQDGIYSTESLPVDGYRWQWATIGLRDHWEDKKAWFDPHFVAFMERDVIAVVDGEGQS